MKLSHLAWLLSASFLVFGCSRSLQAEVLEEFNESVAELQDEYVAADYDGDYGPSWVIGADAVFMTRSRPDSLVLALNAGTGAPILNANSLDFDFAPGWDVNVERETCNGSLEARLLSIDGWDAATAQAFAPTPVLIPTAFPLGVLPGVTNLNTTYDSELLSGELNLRRRLTDWVSLLGGFRYLELDEHLQLTMNAAALPSTYNTVTQNRLYGGQLGADATLMRCGRLTVEGLAKAGVFHNSSRHNTIFGTGVAPARATDRSDRASFVGELTFTATYDLSDCCTLRAGYDLLWLETVALASDQIPATNFFTSGGISADGGSFYQGGFVGLEFRH